MPDSPFDQVLLSFEREQWKRFHVAMIRLVTIAYAHAEHKWVEEQAKALDPLAVTIRNIRWECGGEEPTP
jgi:hypothetical protein